MNPCKTNHKEVKENGICKNCGYNTRRLTNKELKKGVAKKMEKSYTGKKGEYSKTGKQGNWMKVHPLDRA